MLGIALFASFLAPAPAPTPTPAQEVPPGMILVKGGKTKIGTDVDDVERLVLMHEELRNVLVAQTPLHTREVEDFYLMPTEVTNEQYAEYVKATGAKPPRSWGVQGLQAGQAAFLLEQGEAKQKAKAAGLPFDSKVFEHEVWWAEHWNEVPWEIPPGLEANPVVFVKHSEAQAYARWAGLRLMTEFEFQRAARGDSARTYPWGEDWDDKKYCQSLHIGKDLTAQAGSFPDGAVNGIYDLGGNVWEWTSSPFIEYPGYKQLRFSVKKRVFECLAPFDPNQRVAVSGSYQMDRVGVRVATRMNTDRSQSTSALGFRCAASVPTEASLAGLDAAAWTIAEDLNLRVLGAETTLEPRFASILRKWSSTSGTCKVPGYAVVTGYDQILMCPRQDLRASSPSDLATTSNKEGPIFLGFIDVPQPMLRPELDAGTYMVAWRGAGKLLEDTAKADEKDSTHGLRLGGQEEALPFYQMPGFTAEMDCYLFYSADGTAQVAFEAPPVKSERMRMGAIQHEPYVAPPPESLPKDAPPPVPVDTLRVTLTAQSASSRSKGFIFDLPILVKPGTYDSSWK